MKFIKLDDNAVMPSRGNEFAAGYDLYPLNKGVIPPNGRLLIPTGISWRPEGEEDMSLYGHICARSGLARKQGMVVMGGIIDADYEAGIGVILHNTGLEPYKFDSGKAVAQLILKRYEKVSNDLHGEFERGGNGFGSTDREHL